MLCQKNRFRTEFGTIFCLEETDVRCFKLASIRRKAANVNIDSFMYLLVLSLFHVNVNKIARLNVINGNVATNRSIRLNTHDAMLKTNKNTPTPTHTHTQLDQSKATI